MKNSRYVLYAALVVIGMMLWSAWQREHPNTPVEPQQKVQAVNTSKTATKLSSDSYRFHPMINHQVSKVTSGDIQETPNNRLITVKTDTLDISIDKLGGNIIDSNLLKYKKTIKDKTPVKLFNQSKGGYYVAQSGIVLPNQDPDHNPIIYSSSSDHYQLNNKKNLVVKLTGKTSDGLNVIKSYTFKPDSYAITLNYELKNNSNKRWVGSHFMQFTRSSAPQASKGVLGFHSFYGVAISSPAHPFQKYTFKKMTEESIQQTVKGGWIAMDQHYFLGAWVPKANEMYRYYSRMTGTGLATVGIIGHKLDIQPGKTVLINSNLYTGPKIQTRLNKLSPKLWLTIDFGWLGFISIIIFKILKWINEFIGNWGWSIIILTVLIKLVFYHLSATSYKSMAGMRKLQPKIGRLKEQYKDDKQGMSKAMMSLYKKEKINPLGGCLPILIQIPVFIALYYVLLESVELRQAPFMFWIHDLALKDPYYILPILMGVSMYLQQKLSPAPPDPTQAKMMMFLPVIMTVFFLNFPAGLVLYWLVNNVVSVAQQWYITKRYMAGAYDKKKKKKK